MASDQSVTPEGYLRGILADGARALRYRSQVSWLLGIPRSDVDLVPRPSPQPPIVFSDLSAGLWSAPVMASDFPRGDPREHSDPVEGRRVLSFEASKADANLASFPESEETAAAALPATPGGECRPVMLKPDEEERLAHELEHGPGTRNATTALRTLLGLPDPGAAGPGHHPVGFAVSHMASEPAEPSGIVVPGAPAESRGAMGHSDAPSRVSGPRASVPGTREGIVDSGGALSALVRTSDPVPSPVPTPIATPGRHAAGRAAAGTVSLDVAARPEPCSPSDAEKSAVRSVPEVFVEGQEGRPAGSIDSSSYRESGGSKVTCWSDEGDPTFRSARPPSRPEKADDRESLERSGTMAPATATAAPPLDRLPEGDPVTDPAGEMRIQATTKPSPAAASPPRSALADAPRGDRGVGVPEEGRVPFREAIVPRGPGSPPSMRDAPRVAAGRLLQRSRNADLSSELDLSWRSATVLVIGPGSKTLAQIESLQRTVKKLSEQLAQTQAEVCAQPHSERPPPAPSAMTGRRRAWTENTVRAYWERCYLARVQLWGPG